MNQGSNCVETAPVAESSQVASLSGVVSDGRSDQQVQQPLGFFQRRFQRCFQRLDGGSLSVLDGDQQLQFGPARRSAEGLACRVRVHDRRMYRRLMLGGSVGAAESYIEGDWSTDDLTSLIRLMIRNLDRLEQVERSWGWWKRQWDAWQHAWRHNSVSNSRKNIHAHYDLGNDFYELFLDPTLNYSSGLHLPSDGPPNRESMRRASERKMDSLCRQLRLQPGDRVLEIGTGWGAMAIHMAQQYGCRVTTTTISQQQYELARRRVAAAGLEDRVEVLKLDYRHLSGTFDKLVSVEMIEAVGHQYYDEFFRVCRDRLSDRGVMLLQAITIGDQLYQHHIRRSDFISKYVFPGGSLPSISALSQAAASAGGMRMLHQHDLTPHYARTLEHWRLAFEDRREDVRQLGYDEAFMRLWEFYLCYCEAAFAERRVHCTHLMYAKPGCTLDLSLDS